MEHSVLAKLSKLQRSLDPLDIEGLSTIVTRRPTDEYPNESLPVVDVHEVRIGADPNLGEWRKFLDTHFNRELHDKSSLRNLQRLFDHYPCRPMKT